MKRGHLEDLGASRMVHEGKAAGQGEEPPSEGAHTWHLNPDPPRPSSVATVSRTRRRRWSSAGVLGDWRRSRSEKESSAMSSTVATAVFAIGQVGKSLESFDVGEEMRRPERSPV